VIKIAAFVATVFVYSLVSRRLEQTVLTAPILFTVSGAAIHGGAATASAVDRKGYLLCQAAVPENGRSVN
jgi:hypothetical protein